MMFRGNTRKSRAFVYAVGIHIAVLAVLMVGTDFSSEPAPVVAPEVPIVNARAIDNEVLEAQAAKLREADEKKRRDEEQAREAAAKKAAALREEQAELERQKQAEKERVAAEKKKLAAEMQAEKERVAAEKKKLADEKQRLAEQQRKEQAELERQKQVEKERLAAEQKKLAAEKARLEALEKERLEQAKRAAEEKKAQEEAKRAAALNDALALEEKERAAAAQARADETEIARYIAAVRSRVANVFIYPGVTDGLSCTLYVRMIPGGDVVEARVIESSGNASFDRQAENAVRKAAPLPVPSDPRLFQRMREIKFVFDPE